MAINNYTPNNLPVKLTNMIIYNYNSVEPKVTSFELYQKGNRMKNLVIALVQMESKVGKIDKNLFKIKKYSQGGYSHFMYRYPTRITGIILWLYKNWSSLFLNKCQSKRRFACSQL